MNLLDLAEEMGLEPRKTSASRGGEYHCSCPDCGGDDRFMFWPESDRYWCRKCDAKGDAIQFCRDFQKLSFHDACAKTKKDPSGSRPQPRQQTPNSVLIRIPTISWQEKAQVFSESSLQRLLIDKTAIALIQERGLSMDTVKKNRLGWNPAKAFHRRADWGLEEKDNRKWLCLPVGIVIPIFEDNVLRKIKIRISDWKEQDPYGKYYEVPGSSNMLPVFGSLLNRVVVIVEAEFDAMLVMQEAGDLCACVALGGAQKRPHSSLSKWLLERKLILFALDFDDAGKKEYLSWEKAYPNLEAWPVPEEKSPGDYFRAGGNIRDWILEGIKNFGL